MKTDAEPTRPLPVSCDVVVIGSGNAGLCAALSAAEAGADVVVLEKAPREWAGGNSFFTAGAYRIAVPEEQDTLDILASSGSESAVRPETRLPTYPTSRFESDFDRLTGGRAAPDLSQTLMTESTETAKWLGRRGVPWTLLYERQAHRVDGTWQFWGGLFLGVDGQGPVLVERLWDACEKRGVRLFTSAPCLQVRVDDSFQRLDSVVALDPSTGAPAHIRCGAVVIASGGFESNPRLRAAYLGPGWDSAHVRGTPFNTGEVLHDCVSSWAASRGQWSGAHAVAWDAGTSMHEGDRAVSNRATKQGYWLGIVVNEEGQRFLDEGADFRNYTYAKYGREILAQPGGSAFQIFDEPTLELVSEVEYTAPSVVRVKADSFEELAQEAGLPVERFVETMETYNGSVREEKPFNPTALDGKGTHGLVPPKSNWAQPLSRPPYYAFKVKCGVTFTFGGFDTDTRGRVRNRHGQFVRGVYAAGETVGGLFYDNYPGGTGLMSGAVFGRRAGQAAAED